MTTKEIAVNGQVYHCPTEWTVEKATDRIKLGYGLQNGGIEQDNVPVLGTALISSLTGDLAFVGGQPIQQLGKNQFSHHYFSFALIIYLL